MLRNLFVLVFNLSILISLDHGCKNFRKQLEKLVKFHKELKPFVSRSAKAMKAIIKQSNTDVTKFKQLVDMKVSTIRICHLH
jgi:hypothetical protein